MPRKRSIYRNWLEFLPAWLLLKSLGLLPRPAAILMGKLIARAAYRLHSRLRRTGHRNLALAMPKLSAKEREAILTGVVDNLGRSLGEFSQFHKITPRNISDLVIYDGFENYRQAAEQGRGVLLLTGHVGAWE
ncbi:MAG TPA: lipid A biosynthesis acyltransferase, partial [Blastocatellia bacterium]